MKLARTCYWTVTSYRGPFHMRCFAVSSLFILSMRSNALSGTLGTFKYNFEVRWLYIDDNKLTGSVPILPRSAKLQAMTVSGNMLEGTFPGSMLELTNLEIIGISRTSGREKGEGQNAGKEALKATSMTLQLSDTESVILHRELGDSESCDAMFSVLHPLWEGRLRFGLAILNRFPATILLYSDSTHSCASPSASFLSNFQFKWSKRKDWVC